MEDNINNINENFENKSPITANAIGQFAYDNTYLLSTYGSEELNRQYNGVNFYIPPNATSLTIAGLMFLRGEPDFVLPNITELRVMSLNFRISISKHFPNLKRFVSNSPFGHINNNTFPDTLETLELHDTFNNKLDGHINDNVLPKSLINISFGKIYNHPLSTRLFAGCQNLKKIHLGFWFNQQIDENVLPPNLTHLTLSNRYNKKLFPNVLPSTLTHLSFIGENNPDIYISMDEFTHRYCIYPENYIDINEERKEIIDILPDHLVLEELTLGYQFDKPLRNKLNSVNKIKFVTETDDFQLILKTHIREYFHKILCSNVFTYYNKVFVDGVDYTEKIHIRLCINDLLPMPIADEILDNFSIEHN